ncbi:unnamed protein product [Blepharisma stoltei]|uniref:Uncharacterized protein n=1 Tax=Blepharisma stoltei TaxID=1481888 RepID=A0AAU9IEJ4_9CILI|nr:unnamed protein product [Blepharisma stoltei]
MEVNRPKTSSLEVKIDTYMIQRHITPRCLSNIDYRHTVTCKNKSTSISDENFKLPLREASHHRKAEALPEFINEYVYDPILYRKRPKSSFSQKSKIFAESNQEHFRPFTTKLSTKNHKRYSSAPRSRSSSEKKEKLERSLNLFRICGDRYNGLLPAKPQEIKYVKKNLERRLTIDLERRPKSQKSPAVEETPNVKPLSFREVPQINPALTYMEKLYRLNQLSAVKLFD